jgi:hypothetical protein
VGAGGATTSAENTVAYGKSDTGQCPNVKMRGAQSVTVQVPTSATILTNNKQTYSNQTWTSCDGSEHKSNQYGYQRCVNYQVKDQDGDDIQAVLSVSEAETVVDQNISTSLNNGNNSTNADGQFQDDLALLNTSPLPGNACSILKQSFTATGNSSPIRVNCLQYSSTDVTITDVTSNPNSCSKPIYHCN